MCVERGGGEERKVQNIGGSQETEEQKVKGERSQRSRIRKETERSQQEKP